jgi:outer membrane lipopolysaccharide assembly protein LptE/RlpB
VKSKVKSQKSKVNKKAAGKNRKIPTAYFLPLSFILYPLLPFALFFTGCGYHFSGGGTLPQGVQKITLAEIDNETLEVGTEKQLQWALEKEFRKRGSSIVDEGGEGTLNVTMRQLDLRPLSFDSRDQVLEYELILLLDAQLIHRETGKLLWQANNMRVRTDYEAIPQVVVTTSPQFLEGNLNAEDLRGLTDIQFSETQRRAAVEHLFTAAAREVYLRLSEDF